MKFAYYLNIHIDLLTDEIFIIHNKQKLISKQVVANLVFEGEYKNLAIERKKSQEQKRKMDFKQTI